MACPGYRRPCSSGITRILRNPSVPARATPRDDSSDAFHWLRRTGHRYFWISFDVSWFSVVDASENWIPSGSRFESGFVIDFLGSFSIVEVLCCSVGSLFGEVFMVFGILLF